MPGRNPDPAKNPKVRVKDPKAVRRRVRQKAHNSRQYQDLKAWCHEQARTGIVPHGLNPVEVLARSIDHYWTKSEMCEREIDQLREAGEEVPDKLQRQADYFMEKATNASYLAVNNNLQERMVRLQELIGHTELTLIGYFLDGALNELQKRGLIERVHPDVPKELAPIMAALAEAIEGQTPASMIDGEGRDATPRSLMPPPDH